MRMKISLITVSFNSEATIRETLESVKLQENNGCELEYIIVDGGSTDSTLKIVNEYSEIINVLISEPDKGIYNAMNKGIQISTGDILGFLNSDDTYAYNNVLSDITNLFLSNKNLDLIYGDVDYVDPHGTVKREWRCGKQKSFMKGWHPAHPTFYIRKSLLTKHGGFDEDFKIASDFDLMLRYMEVLHCKGYYLNKVLVKMKLGGESNRSFKNIIKGNKEILLSFKKYKLKPRPFYTLFRWISKLLQ